MSKKTAIVLGTFAFALVAVLGLYSFISYQRLENYRLTSKYSAQLAFEETVSAVDRMSETLRKSPYATDGPMCGKLCSQVYADAMAAEAAMSTLPFSTVELEEMAGYLNQVGDYAYSLCSTAVTEGFTGQDVEKLTELSDIASQLSRTLRELQGSVHEGSILLDKRERQVFNVGRDKDASYVSAEFLRFEEEFPHRSSLSYDGRYNKTEEETRAGSLSDAQLLAKAARFAGVSPGDMRLCYEYSGSAGQKCYSAGDFQLVVDGQGVESMSRARLVEESRISEEEALKAAESFLEKQGFQDLSLTEQSIEGNLARFRFCPVQGDVLLPQRCLSLTIAMDDGSIYSFSRGGYSEEKVKAQWNVSEQQAVDTLPESLSLQQSDKVIMESEGGREQAAYRLKCTNDKNEPVTIYVDADTGRQSLISL